MKNRALSLLLAAALTVALALPAGAARVSSFQDIHDPQTAVEADILRLMGVVTGTGNNLFQPESTLTRAEFCAMVIRFLQKEDEVPVYATRTIFSDVTARHWALGYVNLAASMTVPGSGEDETIHLIAGTGSGRFEPEQIIPLAQAVTILLRAMGYSDRQAGGIWPQGHLNLARSIGLLENIDLEADAPIPRALAARLFVNALTCRDGKGEVWYKSFGGTATEKVIILAVNVRSDTGDAMGAIRTTAGTFLPATEDTVPTSLQGRRGTLVVNDHQEIVTFLPDDCESVTFVLSSNAFPSYLATKDKRYVVSADTKVFTADAEDTGKNYSEAYTSLRAGSSVTLYLERGKVVTVFAESSSMAATGDAVVVLGTPTTTMFEALTGGASDCRIQKNHQTISLKQLQPYDVVTYDPLTNTLVASDLHFACNYEDATPNVKAPTSITVLGHTFPVLDSAWPMTQQFSVGENVCLLLTADGRVAGMAPTGSGGLRSNAMGYLDEEGAHMFLPNGDEIDLTGKVSGSSEDRMDRLVTLSSGYRGSLTASRIPSRSSSQPFNVTDMTLGKYTVTPSVRVWEQLRTGVMVQVGLDTLDMESIPGERIASFHLNSSDMVDYIVLQDTTGDAYVYGVMSARSEEIPQPPTEEDEDPDPEILTYWSLTNATIGSVEFSHLYYYGGHSGDFKGMALGKNRNGENRFLAIVDLDAIEHVSPDDFFQKGGIDYVKAGGRTYMISRDVECCRDVGERRVNWFTQETGAERLAACVAFSNDFTIHVDPIGRRVRIIQANRF